MANELISRADAKAQGLKRYFTNLPCKHGHISERVVANSACVACLSDIEKRYRENNRETFLANRRASEKRYRETHPEQIRDKSRRSEERRKNDPVRQESRRKARKKWEEKNPEQRAAYLKKWQSENKDKRTEYGKRWRERNIETKRQMVRKWRDENRHKEEYKEKVKERVKVWVKKNPEAKRAHVENRRARVMGAEGSYTAQEAIDLFKKQNGRCINCDIKLMKSNRSLDHIIALTRGGTNYIQNLQWMCIPCNSRKHNKSPEQWARENGRLL